ncbi:MAG: peptidylprolyl isomerase [Deltaproteobacteria bacterium]|nr:peptidylprolyl isomerase [Deltaproteobacteria bacterium]
MATIVTTLGEITCELFPEQAPKTVLNFVGLAEGTREWTDPASGQKVKRPLYSGTIFHRVIPDFMIQGGDPAGDGTGGPGYRFEDECTADLKFDVPGRLAMANAGPGTNGSQFFITESPVEPLNMKHTIFGQCRSADVVRAIARVPRDNRDRPWTKVVIREIRITK